MGHDSKYMAHDFHYDFEDSRGSASSDQGSPMHTMSSFPSPAPSRDGDEKQMEDNMDIWKNTDDILSRVEASLAGFTKNIPNITKKSPIGISKLAIEMPIQKTKPQRRSRSKRNEDPKSPTNPESGKENAHSNEQEQQEKYMVESTITPDLKNDSHAYEKNKEIEKTVICNISSDNQIPPGFLFFFFFFFKYINDEF